MATLWKHPESKYWVACYTNREGKQIKRSTKETDKSQAMTIALEYERLERQARAGSVTKAQVQKVLSDVSEKIDGEGINTPTVKVYFKEWMEGVKARGSAGGTIERYKNTVRLFLENLGSTANQPISGIGPKHIEAFLNWRLNEGAAPKTAIVDIKTLNSAFKRAEDYNIITKNPVRAVRLPKNVSSEKGVFTFEEVQRLYNATTDFDWQTLILLAFFTGARQGDCIRLRWENIDPDLEAIVYYQKKTGQKVVVPIHGYLQRHLDYLSKFTTEGFLCRKLAAKKSGGKSGLSGKFNAIMKKAGVDPMTGSGKGLRKFSKRTFHSFRHSFNSVLANAGVRDEIRMKLTGHKSKIMNATYTHIDIAPLKTAITSMPLMPAETKPADSSQTKP